MYIYIYIYNYIYPTLLYMSIRVVHTRTYPQFSQSYRCNGRNLLWNLGQDIWYTFACSKKKRKKETQLQSSWQQVCMYLHTTQYRSSVCNITYHNHNHNHKHNYISTKMSTLPISRYRLGTLICTGVIPHLFEPPRGVRTTCNLTCPEGAPPPSPPILGTRVPLLTVLTGMYS